MGIGDAVVINLVTAHDTPGTAPQYRRKAREQPALLVAVGKIIWAIRKDLGIVALEELAESHGISLEAEQIDEYHIEAGGVRLRAMSGPSVWVPWNALKLDGQDDGAVDQLIKFEGWFGPHEIDDDAREVLFTGLGVRLNLDRMMRRARKNEARDPLDAVLC